MLESSYFSCTVVFPTYFKTLNKADTLQYKSIALNDLLYFYRAVLNFWSMFDLI